MLLRNPLIFTIAMFLCSAPEVHGQQEVLDSLENLYLTVSKPTDKLTLLSKIFAELEQTDPVRALQAAVTSVDLARKSAPAKLTYCYNQLGIAYSNLNQFDSAMHYYELGIERAKLTGDSISLSKGYNNLAVVLFNTGNIETALGYMRQCAEIEVATDNFAEASTTFSNIGGICVALDRFDEAKLTLHRGLELADSSNNPKSKAVALHNLSGLYSQLNDYDLAREYAFKEAEICEQNELLSDAATAYFSLATIALDDGNNAESMFFANKALKLAQMVGDLNFVTHALKHLANSAANLGRHREAYEFLLEAMATSDSLANLQRGSTIIEMEKKFKTEETQRQNQILAQQNSIANLENEKNQKELTNSRIVIWSSAGGLLLLIFMAVTLYNRNRIKQRANEELSNANHIIKEKNDDITASLEYASKIQEALLPSKEKPDIFSDAFVLFLPKDIVSGDFFWYTEMDGKKIFTAVDCTGHGVPGAFMSMIGNSFLHEIISEHGRTKPSQILDELRSKVVTALSRRDMRKDGMDMALCTLDEANLTLQYAGANNPLWIVRNNEMTEIKPDKQPVGLMTERRDPFTNHEIKVERGDKIYVFSDGYADQFGGPKGKKFKYKQLKELLLGLHHKPMNEQRTLLKDAFDKWKGNLEQIDDVCVIGVLV